MEALIPVYNVNGLIYRIGDYGGSGTEFVSASTSANGYRLPGFAEWEWAARGGVLSSGYTYSGSNDPNLVSWNLENSSGNTQPVGSKNPNELGIYDMSGNVWEWNYGPTGNFATVMRGGSCDYAQERGNLVELNSAYIAERNQYILGFRLARNLATAAPAPTPAPGPQ